jgi:hypothetical protein
MSYIKNFSVLFEITPKQNGTPMLPALGIRHQLLVEPLRH